MADYTLLDMTQDILSSMDSDEINSVTDNVESRTVARVIKTVYNHLCSTIDFGEHYTFFELLASGSSLRPILMFKPEDVKSIEWIKYNTIRLTETDPNFQDIKWLDQKDFTDMMYSLSLSDDNVLSFDLTVASDSLTILYKDNKAPQFYTSLDDETLIFDSYDAEVDSTLQKNKTMCWGLREPTAFEMTDEFTFDLSRAHMDLLLNEAKSLAWLELKQQVNAKAERMARRGWTKVLPKVLKVNDYGR